MCIENSDIGMLKEIIMNAWADEKWSGIISHRIIMRHYQPVTTFQLVFTHTTKPCGLAKNSAERSHSRL